MQTWHEDSVRSSNTHLERLLETCSVDKAQAVDLARHHGVERHEEHVAQAAHSTNERTADLHEALNSRPAEKKEEPKRKRISIPRGLQNASDMHEGAIPIRH